MTDPDLLVGPDRLRRIIWSAVTAASSLGQSIYKEGDNPPPACLLNQNQFRDLTEDCLEIKKFWVDPWNAQGNPGRNCTSGELFYSQRCLDFFGATPVPCDNLFSSRTIFEYNCDREIEDSPACNRGPNYDDAEPEYGDYVPNGEYQNQRNDLDDLFSEGEVQRVVRKVYTPFPGVDANVKGSDVTEESAVCYYDPGKDAHVERLNEFLDFYTKQFIGDGIDTSSLSSEVDLEAIKEEISRQRTKEVSDKIRRAPLPRIKRFAFNLLGNSGISDMLRLLKANLPNLSNPDRVQRGIADDFFAGLFIAFLEDEVEQGVLEMHLLKSFTRGLSRLEENDIPPPRGITTLPARENYKMEMRAAVMTVVLDGVASLSPAIAITNMETRRMSSFSTKDEVDARVAAAAVAATINAAGVTAAAAFGVMTPDAAAAAISQALTAAAALAVSGTSKSGSVQKLSNYFVEIIRPPSGPPPRIPNTTDIKLDINAGNSASSPGADEKEDQEFVPVTLPEINKDSKEATGIGTEIAVSLLTTYSGSSSDISQFAGVTTTEKSNMSLTQLQARKITINEPIWAEFIYEQVLECFRELCREGTISPEECIAQGEFPTAAPSLSQVPSEVPTPYSSKKSKDGKKLKGE